MCKKFFVRIFFYFSYTKMNFRLVFLAHPLSDIFLPLIFVKLLSVFLSPLFGIGIIQNQLFTGTEQNKVLENLAKYNGKLL